MKVIFLDIDGVLNNAETNSRTPSGFLGISYSLVNNLAAIVCATDARIVLTSTWKKHWEADKTDIGVDGAYLDKRLREYGLRIIDKTDDHLSDRGAGIKKWMEGKLIDSWVVLDDDIFFDYDLDIINHLVLTDSAIGLTDKDARLAIRILNKTEDSYGS